MVFVDGVKAAREEGDKVYDVSNSFDRLGFAPKWKGGFREFMEIGDEEEPGM